MFMPSIFGESFFDNLLDGFVPAKIVEPFKGPMMKTDIKETGTGFDLDIELPGYSKEDVSAELKDGYMTIKATHSQNTEDKDPDGKYLRKERYYGSCQRSFFVGEDIKEEDIKARFENGVLKINVPKKEALPEPETKKFIAIEG